jgi:hypothetical protein
VSRDCFDGQAAQIKTTAKHYMSVVAGTNRIGVEQTMGLFLLTDRRQR